MNQPQSPKLQIVVQDMGRWHRGRARRRRELSIQIQTMVREVRWTPALILETLVVSAVDIQNK